MKHNRNFTCVRCKKKKQKHSFSKNGNLFKSCDSCRVKNASRRMAYEQYASRPFKLSTNTKVYAYHIFLMQNRLCKICRRRITLKSAFLCWRFNTLDICCFFCNNLAEDFDKLELQEFMQDKPFRNVHIHNIHMRGVISCKIGKHIPVSQQIVGYKQRTK